MPSFSRLWEMVDSCKITSMFKETSRNLDTYPLADSVGRDSQYYCPRTFPAYFPGSSLEFLLLNSPHHGIWGFVYVKSNKKVLYDIILAKTQR